MVRVFGYSDDLCEIEGSTYPEDEIGCYNKRVRLWFADGTVASVEYSPEGRSGVWSILIEQYGTARKHLTICGSEDDFYSDVLDIDSEIVRHEVVSTWTPFGE